ncbi:MAG TPA: formate dehydrogenase accessory protein FdhE [Armatimonadota bacterium]
MNDTIVRQGDIEVLSARLNRIARQHPDLAWACGYYHDLLTLQLQAEAETIPFYMDPACIQAKLAGGEPLLVGEGLPFSVSRAMALCAQVTAIVESSLDRSAAPAALPEFRSLGEDVSIHHALRALRQAAVRRDLPLIPVFYSLLWGDDEPLLKLAQATRLDVSLMHAIVSGCLRPFLHAWRASLAPQIDLTAWDRPRCPFCGSPPYIAELRGPDAMRYFHCDLCGAEWSYEHLQCPHCANRIARLLGSLRPDPSPTSPYALTCNLCYTYLKVLPTNEPLTASHLPLVHLETASLDDLAANRGYHRM